MSILLAKNAEVLVTMVDQRRKLKNAGIYVEDGFIKQIGPSKELPAHADVVLDLSGQILLPGFVNTHHHLDQTLTRNLPAAQNNNLFPWLQVHHDLRHRRVLAPTQVHQVAKPPPPPQPRHLRLLHRAPPPSRATSYMPSAQIPVQPTFFLARVCWAG